MLNNPNQAYAARLIAERNAERTERELAELQKEIADEYIVELTERSKEIYFKSAIKDSKVLTLINRLNKAFPNDVEKIDTLIKGVEHDYENDPEWLANKRTHTNYEFNQETIAIQEKKKALKNELSQK